MHAFRKNLIGADIFNESLTLCGYDFSEPVYQEIERRFANIRETSPSDFIGKKEEFREFFKYISKSMTFSLLKPAVLLSLPEEFFPPTQEMASVIEESGFDTPRFCRELLAAVLGCGLPLCEADENGLLPKFIFALGKRRSTTFCVCCAGDIYESRTIHFRLPDIGKSTLEETVDQLSNKKLDDPDSLQDKRFTDEIRSQIKASLALDIRKTLYIMDYQNDTIDYMIDGFDVKHFHGGNYLASGLQKILGAV